MSGGAKGVCVGEGKGEGTSLPTAICCVVSSARYVKHHTDYKQTSTNIPISITIKSQLNIC